MLTLLFVTYLAASSALPFDESEAISLKTTEDVEDYELLSDLLTVAAELDEDDLEKFLEEGAAEDGTDIFSKIKRNKREIPEWVRILFKCTVHYFFPKTQIYNIATDIETLFDKGYNAKAIVDEISTKYEEMETKAVEDGTKAKEDEDVTEVGRSKRSVEEVKTFFRDPCVQDAINYGIKNREKIKCAWKKSIEWAKRQVRKMRESKGWNRLKRFFRRDDSMQL